ncbi:hypothetical protein [Vallicoccus soli]|uniref:hypothetical protein n=1 Tax=Vallicoccus soli TaxID=2339232 RepID=UPI001403D4E8|nr:hypothetical protein [Vallicoccus soli]
MDGQRPAGRRVDSPWDGAVRSWALASALLVLLIVGGVVLWFAVDERVLAILLG